MTTDDDRFTTHIKEPRWQQIASIVIALGIVATWLWFALHVH